MIKQLIEMRGLLSVSYEGAMSLLRQSLPNLSNVHHARVCFLNVFNNLKSLFWVNIDHENFFSDI